MTEVDFRLVIDIGKTHAKIHLLDKNLQSISEHQHDNQVISQAPYAHFDTHTLWQWMLSTIASLTSLEKARISAICITTHGAAAALVDRNAEELVLPILDYESAAPEKINNSYQKIRPAFSETLSPALPLGLNLGRQLYWLAETFPSEFARTTDILLLPQYWAWRFSGVLAAECSSLGCHTDLWNIAAQDYSTLVDVNGWRPLFPPLKKAWDSLGPIRTNLQAQLGLPSECQIYTGIHDSNASLLRYLQTTDENFALISTGTWTIAMASGAPLEVLDKDRDMLANCDARGRAVACSRFMGGREYANICAQLGSPLGSPKSFGELQHAIDTNCFALPNFSEGSGPFPKTIGKFIGGTHENASALATLYCALMMDLQLELLEAKNDIYIEGSFLKNPFMLAVLAQLRAPQTLYISESQFGTVQGCALLSQWNSTSRADNHMRIGEPAALKSLDAYKKSWREQIQSLVY